MPLASFHRYCSLIFSTSEARLRKHVFVLRQAAWFAKNSTTADEYGLAAAANYQLLRHRFFAEFCLQANSAI